MTISLADLQLLLDVVDTGSFSQAAARHGWSQPQVSQRIALLESDLGAALFTRHRRGAVPTEACTRYVDSVRRALAELDNGRQSLQGTPTLPRVAVACMPSMASVIFGPLIEMLADAPLEIRCHTDHSPDIMENLLVGRIQVGFVLKCPTMAGIQMEPLGKSPIVAVVSADHPLAQQSEPLTLTDVACHRISPQYWGEGCQELIQLIRARRGHPEPIHANQPAATARELAIAYGFVTFMPAAAVVRDLLAGRLKRLTVTDLPSWHWEVMVAYRTGKRPNAPKDAVLDAARALATGWRATGVAT
ncbi:LysR family transcriptional regulator [Chitinivorax sp. B]|uniref:LysR family transcriptional regulator n=1 Tax=Chitinivorax sp. B TaxID=2502235 RepID=UPI0010F931FD|nr:LysR family transcriptional regulator [Chitinivorax sp. B]